MVEIVFLKNVIVDGIYKLSKILLIFIIVKVVRFSMIISYVNYFVIIEKYNILHV